MSDGKSFKVLPSKPTHLPLLLHAPAEGFWLPTADEIADFSAVVAPIYAQIRVNALENARLKGLRDSLLPRLMSGELDVSDIQG